jgi:hypothetical protein
MEAGRACLRDQRDHASTATALLWAGDEHGIGPLLGRVGEDVRGAARRGATSTPRFRGGGPHTLPRKFVPGRPRRLAHTSWCLSRPDRAGTSREAYHSPWLRARMRRVRRSASSNSGQPPATLDREQHLVDLALQPRQHPGPVIATRLQPDLLRLDL